MDLNPSSFLKEHLLTYFQLKSDDFESISQYFKDDIPSALIQDFLILSKDIVLIPLEKQQFSSLVEQDAVKKAAEYHKIIFENDTIRVLDIIVPPGKSVPFHTHQWDCIAITLKGSKFKILDSLGVSKEEDWSPVVEKIEGSFDAYSYTNLGSEKFHAILFEIKK